MEALTKMALLFAIISMAISPQQAKATQYIYTYVGNPFDTFYQDYNGNYVRIQITSDHKLLASTENQIEDMTSVIMYDNDDMEWALNTNTNAKYDSITTSFSAVTIGALSPEGLPQAWNIALMTPNEFGDYGTLICRYITSSYQVPSLIQTVGWYDNKDMGSFWNEPTAFNCDNPGTWSLTTTSDPIPTPEPSTFLLLAVGVGGAICFMRKKKGMLHCAIHRGRS